MNDHVNLNSRNKLNERGPEEEEAERNDEGGGEEGARVLCDVPLQPKRPLI